jgi:hypothetical protein
MHAWVKGNVCPRVGLGCLTGLGENGLKEVGGCYDLRAVTKSRVFRLFVCLACVSSCVGAMFGMPGRGWCRGWCYRYVACKGLDSCNTHTERPTRGSFGRLPGREHRVFIRGGW